MSTQVFGQRKPPRGLLPDYQHPLMRGLIGWWMFNEGHGDRVYDLSSLKMHGDFYNIDETTDWLGSQFGPALKFDGNSTSVDLGTISVGHPLTLQSGGYTISVWLKLDTKYGDTYQRIIAKQSGEVSIDGWIVLIDRSTEKFAMYIDNVQAISWAGSGTVGVWTNIVFVYDSSTQQLRLYQDGNYVALGSGVSNPPNVSTDMEIGKPAGANNSEFEGSIADVRIFNRTLNADEVFNLYSRPYEMFERRAPAWAFAPVAEPIVGKPVYFGSIPVDKLYLGATDIPKAYLGDILVFGSELASTDCVLVVRTTGADETFVLGTFDVGSYNATVDWGDGQQDTITVWNDAALTHTYATPGDHEVHIDGTFPAFIALNGDEDKIVELKNWGDIGRLRLADAKRDCGFLDVTATDDLHLSGNVDATRMFQNAVGVTGLDLRGWGPSTPYLTSLASFLNLATSSVPLLDNWDVANVTSFSSTFRFSEIDEDLSAWNMSAATNMSLMFASATSMSTANTDNFLYALWNHRNDFTWATPTVNISDMGPPSGVYQDPQGTPTTGLEYVYVLENDPDGEGFNTWSITY